MCFNEIAAKNLCLAVFLIYLESLFNSTSPNFVRLEKIGFFTDSDSSDRRFLARQTVNDSAKAAETACREDNG